MEDPKIDCPFHGEVPLVDVGELFACEKCHYGEGEV